MLSSDFTTDYCHKPFWCPESSFITLWRVALRKSGLPNASSRTISYCWNAQDELAGTNSLSESVAPYVLKHGSGGDVLTTGNLCTSTRPPTA